MNPYVFEPGPDPSLFGGTFKNKKQKTVEKNYFLLVSWKVANEKSRIRSRIKSLKSVMLIWIPSKMSRIHNTGSVLELEYLERCLVYNCADQTPVDHRGLCNGSTVSCFRDAHQRSFSYDRSYQERSSFANDHDRHDKFRFNASFKYDERRDKHRNRFVAVFFLKVLSNGTGGEV